MNRDRVHRLFESLGVQYAVIGAIAVAARGAPRSTFDFDLFTTDHRVLETSAWRELRESGIEVDVRKGDFDDPLAGVIRVGKGLDQVDVVVGKWKWEEAVIERAEIIEIDGIPMRIPQTSDLILLKLAAGGPIDQQDVVRLLAANARDRLVEEVNERIGGLPDDARLLWQKMIDIYGQ